MICGRCGEKLPEGAKFCFTCGKKQEDRNIRKQPAKNLYQWITLSAYAIAILTCFICNLAIEHTLSWFFIMLSSIGLGFAIFNLPFLLKRYRLVIPAMVASLLIYLLLFICDIYTKGAAPFRVSSKIATYPIVIAWVMILTITWRGLNWFYKSAILSLIIGVTNVTMNVWIDAVLSGNTGSFLTFFKTQFDSTGSNYFINGIIALCFFAYFVVGMVLGTIALVRRKRYQA